MLKPVLANEREARLELRASGHVVKCLTEVSGASSNVGEWPWSTEASQPGERRIA